MRATKARAIRRRVYGDQSPRTREYIEQQQFVLGKPHKTGARYAIGFRRVYQDTKAHA